MSQFTSPHTRFTDTPGTPKWHEDLAVASSAITPPILNNTIHMRSKLHRAVKLKPTDTSAWYDYLSLLNKERNRKCNDSNVTTEALRDMRRALVNLYDQATKLIPRTASNRYSYQYLQIWLDYIALRAENDDDHYIARESFKDLKIQRIGQSFPQFWNAWADFEEKSGSSDKAAKYRLEARLRSKPPSSTPNASRNGASSLSNSSKRRVLKPPRRLPMSEPKGPNNCSVPTSVNSTPASISKSLPPAIYPSPSVRNPPISYPNAKPSPTVQFTPTAPNLTPIGTSSFSPEILRSNPRRSLQHYSPVIVSPTKSPQQRSIAPVRNQDSNIDDDKSASASKSNIRSIVSTNEQHADAALASSVRQEQLEKSNELERERLMERLDREAREQERERERERQRERQKERERERDLQRERILKREREVENERNFERHRQETFQRELQRREEQSQEQMQLEKENTLQHRLMEEKKRREAKEIQSRALERERDVMSSLSQTHSNRYIDMERSRNLSSGVDYGADEARVLRRKRGTESAPEEFRNVNQHSLANSMRYPHDSYSTDAREPYMASRGFPEHVPQNCPPAWHREPSRPDIRSPVVVNRRKYHVLKCIGKGASSKVYRVLDEQNSEVLALKRIKVNFSPSNSSALEPYINEIELLKTLHGSCNIVQLHGAEVDQENGLIQLIMEYGERDLNRHISEFRKEAEQMVFNFIRITWAQMLRGVQAMHEARIVHGDLKPANFIIVEGTLKLIDFGIAKAMQTEDTTKIMRDSPAGTPNYMSPEALTADDCDLDIYSSSSEGTERSNTRQIRVGRASDIWSLGCILYQMVYGRTPFAHIKKMNQKMKCIQNPNYEIPFQPVGNALVVEVLKGCLQRDPAERINIPELLQHEFLVGTVENAQQPSKPPSEGEWISRSKFETDFVKVERSGGQIMAIRRGDRLYEQYWSENRYGRQSRYARERFASSSHMMTPTSSLVTHRTTTRSANGNNTPNTNTNLRF